MVYVLELERKHWVGPTWSRKKSSHWSSLDAGGVPDLESRSELEG